MRVADDQTRASQIRRSKIPAVETGFNWSDNTAVLILVSEIDPMAHLIQFTPISRPRESAHRETIVRPLDH